ncbi:major facilitator superfamily transporter [Aphelenchoides avenae]|nr:major facilitator superfamily transporter [Aphelenchus avenae]
MVCMVNRTALAIIANSETGMNDSDLLTPPITSPFVESANNTEGFVLDMQSFNDTPTTFDGECGSSKSAKKRVDDAYEGDLVISKSDQALIFTSFYAGGLAIVMPGSYLCDWFGARSLVLVGAMINVIGTFATPVVARTMGSMALAALRFVMGCGQGILVPCMNVLITHWFPLSEKSTAIAIATTGNQLSWLGGWPSAFYTYGVVGVILCVTWFVCVYDTPAKAKRISEEEVRFIHGGEAPPSSRKLQNVPWSRMMRSLPVWSLSLCAFSQNFMNVGTVVYLPSYYNSVLRMDLTSNGVMSALPFVVQLVTKILFAWMADTLKARQLMSHTNVTKMFNLIASLGSGVCFILITYCDCRHTEWAIFLAVAAVGLSSGFIPGYNTSRLLGQIASVASPYMIGIIVKKGTREEWQVAFYVMAFVLISTGLLFQVGGSGWALQAFPA